MKKAYDDPNFWQKLSKENPKTQTQVLRYFAKTDLFFLCRYVIGWEFYNHPYARWFCDKVQTDPWQLWLVARGHLKSLTITCAHTIQLIINDPEKCTCIFSYNNPTAKAFLMQIKYILETNQKLKDLFPEIFYENPQTQSPKWTENEGIVVKRKTTRKEPTVMACGLTDSQKTGYHFDYHKHDDTVIQTSVTTPEMIEKTTRAWELSDNLGMMDAETKKSYCGTRYHYFDTYKTIMERGVKTTIIPATVNGKEDGQPIYMTRDVLAKKRQEQGLYTFSAQMLLNPISDKDKKFQREWIQYWDELPQALRIFIMVDPANTKKKKSDWTSMLVVGMDDKGDVYLVDGIHDKLSLGERYETFLSLVDRHKPVLSGYEKYGMQADLEFFNLESRRTGRRLPAILELGGTLSKEDRILRLVPDMENRKIYFPHNMLRWCKYDNKQINIVDDILAELDVFPIGEHDDLIDCLSRIYDMKPTMAQPIKTTEQNAFDEYMKQKTRKEKTLDFSFLKNNNAKKKDWWEH